MTFSLRSISAPAPSVATSDTVPFAPTDKIEATDLQGAVVETRAELEAKITENANHIEEINDTQSLVGLFENALT